MKISMRAAGLGLIALLLGCGPAKKTEDVAGQGGPAIPAEPDASQTPLADASAPQPASDETAAAKVAVPETQQKPVAIASETASSGGGQRVAGEKVSTASEVPMQAPASFAICGACHSIKPGQNGIGPSLAGVVGRKAGTTSFTYSAAMKNSGTQWTEAELDGFLAAPAKKIPGTTMSFGGLRDAKKRREIVDYLKSL